MQWSISNKGSGSQLLSFRGNQEDKPKTGFESLASAGLVSITTTESHDSVMQKNIVLGKQGGVPYTVTTYSAQHVDDHSVHPPEIRAQPITGQTNQSVSMASLHRSFSFPAVRNLDGLSSAQNVGDVSTRGSIPAVPPGINVVGTTDLWSGSKIAVTSAQMTIFYNGSVCVYDSISPEKAQAIMLLAGNGPPMTSSTTPPVTPIQAPLLRSSVIDGVAIRQSHSVTPCISLSAAATSLRSSGGLISPCSTAEPPKVVNTLGSSPNAFKKSAVPQARKASLVRFLESRRGRIVSASPYAKKQASDASATASGSQSFVMNSSGSSLMPARS